MWWERRAIGDTPWGKFLIFLLLSVHSSQRIWFSWTLYRNGQIIFIIAKRKLCRTRSRVFHGPSDSSHGWSLIGICVGTSIILCSRVVYRLFFCIIFCFASVLSSIARVCANLIDGLRWSGETFQRENYRFSGCGLTASCVRDWILMNSICSSRYFDAFCAREMDLI